MFDTNILKTTKAIFLGVLKEFKEFAMKGSIVDLAVAVIIGTAFGEIITALTDNILMPVIGSFIGKSFESMTAVINGVPVQYGAFIQAIVIFIIIAFLIFLLIKAINSTKKKQAEAPDATPEDIILLREIRDARLINILRCWPQTRRVVIIIVMQ